MRLKELHTAVSGVYAPGMRITLLSDAQHYRPRPGAQTRAYAETIGEYVQMAEASDFIEVPDIDEQPRNCWTRVIGPSAWPHICGP